MPEQLTLDINRVRYGGWKSVRVMRSMEHIAGGFELSVSDRWPGQDAAFPIHPGDACEVAIDDDVVITGYVDDVDRAHDASSHEISVRGRDKTGDLVDCSAVPGKWEWANRKMEEIASDLINPFSIGLLTLTDTGPRFPKFAVEPGEPVFDALDRMSRICGVLMTSNGTGDLVITRRGKERVGTALVLGKNILSARVALSMMDRYQTYIVKGDRALGGTSGDSLNWEDANRQGTVKDERVKRHRPLIILAETQGDAANFETRAEWERSVRFARASRATITVQGWRHADDLWRPNKLARVVDPTLGLDADLLVSAVTFTMDEQGRRTELSLTYPEAFDLIPLGIDENKDLLWDLLGSS